MDAAIAQLAEAPPDALTLRAVARGAGVSRASVLLAFRSPSAVLDAVGEALRERVEAVVQDVLTRHRGPLQRASALTVGLVSLFEAAPGLARLVLATAPDAPARRSVDQVLSMTAELVARLVDEAGTAGAIPPNVDGVAAGRLYVTLLAGALLEWERSGRRTPLTAEPFEVLAAALAAGAPKQAGGQRVTTGDETPIAVLDVRPLLEAGRDPLGAIRATLRTLAPDGVLRITAPFRPKPLITLLQEEGYRVSVWTSDRAVFEVDVAGPRAPAVVDLRDLPAPEPMERILERAAQLPAGGVVIARVPRAPNLLLPRLAERGLEHAAHEERDGTALLWVRRPS